jgi:PAS domain S-box-containing protein
LDALAESEEKYRLLFENDSDAVMIFDSETRQFEDANPSTLKLFGYIKEEFLSLKVEDISAEKDKTRIAVGKVSSAKTHHLKVLLRYFCRKDGSIFPGEISAGKFSSGGRQKIIGAVRDITDRIQSEDKIRALTREQEVLRLLAEGLPSRKIAKKLFISPKTVENHRANIMNKLDLRSPTELVRYAAKLGLIDVDLWTN